MSDPAPETPATEAPPETPAAGGIPPERLAAVARARDEALAQATAAAEQVAQLTQQFEQARQQMTAFQSDLALAEHGLIDPAARAIARTLHGMLPEADRPDLAAWVAQAKADPATAPLGLRGYLAAPASAGPPSGSAPAPAPAAASLPSSTPSVHSPPPPTSRTDSIRAANQAMAQAMKSGDQEAIKAAKSAVNKALGSLA